MKRWGRLRKNRVAYAKHRGDMANVKRHRTLEYRIHVSQRSGGRPDYGHLTIDVTIDDPGAYTKPWGNRQEMHLRAGWEPMEFICGENNVDLPHLPK